MMKATLFQHFIGTVGEVLGQIWELNLQDLVLIWSLEWEYYFAKGIRELHVIWDLLFRNPHTPQPPHSATPTLCNPHALQPPHSATPTLSNPHTQ